MKRHLSMDQRLREYGDWLAGGPLELPLGPSVFSRIREEQGSAAARSEGQLLDIVDGVACRPDGGMSRMLERMGAEVARDNRCREIADLMPYLPQHHRQVLSVVYFGPEPRTAKEAAQLLEVSVGKFCERKAALLAWFEGAMFRGLAV